MVYKRIRCDDVRTINPNDLVFANDEYSSDNESSLSGGGSVDEITPEKAKSKIAEAEGPNYCLSCKNPTRGSFEHIKESIGQTGKSSFYIISKCSNGKCGKNKAMKISTIMAGAIEKQGKKRIVAQMKPKKKRQA